MAKQTILIVDDEDYIRQIFVSALSEFNIVDASHGTDAIELARQQPPDLLVTDVRMPDMDGLELIDEIRQLYPGLPTLVISGSLESSPKTSAEFEFMRKPVRLAELVAKVKELLGAESSNS